MFSSLGFPTTVPPSCCSGKRKEDEETNAHAAAPLTAHGGKRSVAGRRRSALSSAVSSSSRSSNSGTYDPYGADATPEVEAGRGALSSRPPAGKTVEEGDTTRVEDALPAESGGKLVCRLTLVSVVISTSPESEAGRSRWTVGCGSRALFSRSEEEGEAGEEAAATGHPDSGTARPFRDGGGGVEEERHV